VITAVAKQGVDASCGRPFAAISSLFSQGSQKAAPLQKTPFFRLLSSLFRQQGPPSILLLGDHSLKARFCRVP
jgi:hypothetical protein